MAPSVLGPPHPTLVDGVRFVDGGDRLQLIASHDLSGLSSQWFAEVQVYVGFTAAELGGPGIELLGFAFTQFAMPVRAGLPGRFDFNPSPALSSPPTVLPLLLRRADGTVCLLAPLDAWHEQVIAVVQDGRGINELRWGWHGDLDEVPAGLTTTLGVYEGRSAADLLDTWGAEIQAAAGTERLDRYADPVVSHLSYWTDNGAAYWYRTEPGLDLPATLEAKMGELDQLGVAVGAVELDSWFYPHEISRAVSEVGYLEEVPPTGMVEWKARPDVLPGGIASLAERLGGRPLVLHSRHISPRSPYLAEGEWWVDFAAHPVDQDFFRRWFDDASRWGATCIEQDWMMLSWFGVRQLRSTPGRALAWQRALDRAARETGLTLLWCMPTPGDLMASVELGRVVAVRTSDDYRYAADPALLWHWYLTVNRLACALGLVAFKDCFFSAPARAGAERDDLDGDPHPEIEALLSALSAGAAGIGDRLGRTDPAIVARLCRPDGRLVKPDRPLAMADQSLFRPPGDPGGLCWSTTSSGRWRYVVALHTASVVTPIADSFALDGEWLVYDWRRQAAAPAHEIGAELARRDWALYVCCPIEVGAGGVRQALIGDPLRYATMGDMRLTSEPGAEPIAHLASGEASMTLRWWREDGGLFDERRPAAGRNVRHDENQ